MRRVLAAALGPDWVWRNDDWVLTLTDATGAPILLILQPRRVHYDLTDVPDDRAASTGRGGEGPSWD